jgi:hypothetical protein
LFLRVLRRSFVFSFADNCWNGQGYKRHHMVLNMVFFPCFGRLSTTKAFGIISLTFIY